MADYPTETRFFNSFDGVSLAWHEMGEGFPVVLIHGFMSNAFTNWIRYGHAAKVAAKGFRVIMPDLRAHGESAKPHAAAAYPKDVHASDGLALVAHLGLTDYHLGGYSLGARTTMRMLARGATPGKVVLSGMGLDGMLDTNGRADHFRRILGNLGTWERGSDEWYVEQFLKTTKSDPDALLSTLDAFAGTPTAVMAAMDRPTLVLCGEDDFDNGSAADLAELLPNAEYRTIPGNHMSAVIKKELGDELADFIGA